MDGPDALINLRDYTPLQLILFGLGGLGYVIVYSMFVRRIVKRGFVEVPVAAVIANLSWEFVWSFVFRTDFGVGFVWGYRAWFFLDVFIAYGAFRYGAKQFKNGFLRQHFRWGLVFTLIAWTVGVWLYGRQGYDISTGLVSGYAITAFMSGTFVLLFITHDDPSDFSYAAAWIKMVAATLASISCCMMYPDNYILLWLCLMTFALDLTYVLVFRARVRRVA